MPVQPTETCGKALSSRHACMTQTLQHKKSNFDKVAQIQASLASNGHNQRPRSVQAAAAVT